MTDVSGLCLVPNCYRDMCLVYKPRKPSHAHLAITPPPFETETGDEFLLWQSASRRILVFAVDSNIRLLAAMQTWDMDGIFKVVPQWYEQLFTIRSFVMGKENGKEKNADDTVQKVYGQHEADQRKTRGMYDFLGVLIL
ncbi:hypothetical protein T4E_7118 [Trichinella pseudospiralis]|uniref:Uncharacterized protein n=1 Tax=Trichinella pseudospiralis TaxID=6337 RepID=A0A0V0XL68_TRIPS|nr:hypothetical protein T4E_7118 [Trichinella pseudospiralis]